MKIYRTQSVILVIFVLLSISTDLIFSQQQCFKEIEKLSICISYASGKSNTPTEDCCSNVKDIKKDNPICLCYIILHTHKGDASFKQLGLQEAKLIQLPSACSLSNTTGGIKDCPGLLKLSPSSPDYAFFTNTSTPEVKPAAMPQKEPSVGIFTHPKLAGPMATAFAIIVLISEFQMGLPSLF